MKDKLFDNVNVCFVVRSPLTGKVFYVSDNFDDAVHLSSLLENDKKQTEIVIAPLIVNYGDLQFKQVLK